MFHFQTPLKLAENLQILFWSIIIIFNNRKILLVRISNVYVNSNSMQTTMETCIKISAKTSDKYEKN